MEVIADKLPIHINGYEKYATGLTKRTTVDDVKYAILSVTESNFKLDDYAIFEKWQGNECMLDGKLKIYKLIRLWKSLPGDQLSKVKFTIKKRKGNPCASNNAAAIESSKYNVVQEHMKQQRKNSGKATLHYYSEDFVRPSSALSKSPLANKTWNNQKAANALKRSSRKRDEPVQQASSTGTSSCEDNSDYEASSSNEENRYERRYSSVRRFNRSRKSTVRKAMIKQQFIDLVNKQNEIIDKQLNKISQNDYLLDNLSRSESRKTQRSKSLDKVEAKLLAKKMKSRDYSSSLRVKDDSQYKTPAPLPVEPIVNDISENDVRLVFDDILDDKQVKEYVKLCNNYFSLQNNVSQNRQRIDELNDEIKLMKCERELNSKLTQQSAKQIQKTSQKLQSSVDTYGKQNEKLENLTSALSRIDKIILLKTSLIQTLENELKTLENEQLYVDNDNEMVTRKLTTVLSTSSTASSLSSASSNVTSVSQQQQQQQVQKMNNPVQRVKNCLMTYVGDNDSDTGISSANSEDFGSTQLETLV